MAALVFTRWTRICVREQHKFDAAGDFWEKYRYATLYAVFESISVICEAHQLLAYPLFIDEPLVYLALVYQTGAVERMVQILVDILPEDSKP